MRDSGNQWALVAALLFNTSCKRMDVDENIYRDAPAAIAAGAVERGWLPFFLPTSATAIYESHNVDTNDVWVHFQVKVNDVKAYVEHCRRIDRDTAVARVGKNSPAWWPSFLEKKISEAGGAGYTFYICADGGYSGVDGKGRVFYWRND